MKALVGYTGFVGSNLYAEGRFDGAYNSKNIQQAYGTRPDLLIYAGLRAEKYLANSAPDQDMALILQAEENITKIAPKKLVLISTVDVFKVPEQVDERSTIDTEGLPAYGSNRYQLECWVRERYPDALIVRLPGLFGQNLKKNFIYDFINVIPFMLKASKLEELVRQAPQLRDYYTLQDNGFYRVRPLAPEERDALRGLFRSVGFTALNFTDSRSVYQFYDLRQLWGDLQTALELGIPLWHPATEPVSAGELYQYLTGGTFVNELPGTPAGYDYRTIYAQAFGRSGHYIRTRQEVLAQIQDFIRGESA